MSDTFFSPKTVNDIFVQITQRPHCSGDENAVRTYVGDFVLNLKAAGKPVDLVHYNPDATELGDRVIVAKKAAYPGYENCPTIILQAHMDMVCKPNANIFPLTLLTYKDANGVEWLKAGSLEPKKGTTLGADDGIGVAIALAILADDSIQCGPLEFLFTVEEETTMGGAANFQKEWLTGRIFINLDSEDKNIVTYGSAGGIDTVFTYLPTLSEIDPETQVLLKLKISGLKGGHSGADINKGRASAIKLMVRALCHLNKRMSKVPDINKHFDTKTYEFYLYQFSSNDVDNAIPSEAEVIIALAKEDVVNFQGDFNQYCQVLKKEYEGVEAPEFTSEIVDYTTPHDLMFTAKSTDDLINLLLATPHGVMKMSSQVKDLVETSTNLAMVKIEGTDRAIQITCSHRSSTDSGLEYVVQIHQAIAASFGYRTVIGDWYPSWTPDENSPLLKIARGVYQLKYGPAYKSEVIHAGLECSWVVEHYKGDTVPMDAISLGPTVVDVHTPDERLDTASVQEFWDSLLAILKLISRIEK